jgi:hypothetical protein
MGSIHLRAIRNGLVAAVLTATAGFALNWAFGDDGVPAPVSSGTRGSSADCRPRAERVDRSALRGLAGRFVDVWLDSPADGWAVGSVGDPEADASAVLARWDGSAWTPSSDVGDTSTVDVLQAVDGTAADDVWGVGWSSDGAGRDALTVHFDGSSWTASDAWLDAALFDVRTLTEDDVWAVGSAGDPEIVNERAIALHWDGSTWTRAPLPVGGGRSGLFAIAGTTGDLWAVGYHHRGPLVLRYDGTTWTRTADVDARGPLDAVATADATVWLAGRSVLRGDGSNFTQVATAPRRGRFSAIAATAADRAFAVGSVVGGDASTALAVELRGGDATTAHVRAPGDDALEAIALVGGHVWIAGWHASASGIVPLVAILHGC